MIDRMVKRWTSTERPLLKGGIFDYRNGTYSAQGDVLHVAGWTDDEILSLTPARGDKEVAKLLGISRAHSVLLRRVNGAEGGCPQDVLTAPEKILGDNAQTVLSFWRYLDTLTTADWQRLRARDLVPVIGGEVVAACDASSDAAGAKKGSAAWFAANDSTMDTAWAGSMDTLWETAVDGAEDTAWATNEIQGECLMIERGRPFYFLPKFGFPNPQAVRDWERFKPELKLAAWSSQHP